MSAERYTFLVEATRPEIVATVTDALEEAGIPFHSGLLAGKRPSVIFTVPEEVLEQARTAVAEALDERERSTPARFPARPVLVVGLVILFHFLVVFWMMGSEDEGRWLIGRGALLAGRTAVEPWRLVTSLFLHSDPLHAFWNGASMLAFAVPLLTQLGYARTALVYFASGIGGGITALQFARAGTLIVGSSGAIAGLFGAWLVLTLGRIHLEPLRARARIRTLGIAMLVIPSLLSPITSTGHPVSVSSHIGGLVTGAVIGASISFGLLRRGARFFAERSG